MTESAHSAIQLMGQLKIHAIVSGTLLWSTQRSVMDKAKIPKILAILLATAPEQFLFHL